MSEMVERVACAIYGEITLNGLGQDVQDTMMDKARAAIEAMREPTVPMATQTAVWTADPSTAQLTFAERVVDGMHESDPRAISVVADVVRDWQTMIDAALAE